MLSPETELKNTLLPSLLSGDKQWKKMLSLDDDAITFFKNALKKYVSVREKNMISDENLNYVLSRYVKDIGYYARMDMAGQISITTEDVVSLADKWILRCFDKNVEI